MIRYEYMTLDRVTKPFIGDVIDELNILGSQGWRVRERVRSDKKDYFEAGFFFLERQIVEPEFLEFLPENLTALKAELETLGCQVTITLERDLN